MIHHYLPQHVKRKEYIFINNKNIVQVFKTVNIDNKKQY